ncbi:MAG: vWA domain-containing protein, partial [Pseudomonas sp.]
LVLVLALGGGAYWYFGVPPKPDKTPAVTQTTPPEVKPTPPTTQTTSTASVTPAADADGGDRPLLMAGKKTLFQRVLSKPGAQLAADAGAAPGSASLPAFSVLYVYARKQVGGADWLKVGAASDGRSEGWLPATQVSDWKQSLVLKFTERSGRAPVMFLKQPQEVERLLQDVTKARNELTLAQRDDGSAPQVVAIEPQNSAVSQEQFYLLPIFESRESFDADGQPVQLLNVASIDPGNAPQVKGDGQPVGQPDAFRTGIVLVVDTSVSMQPYIDRVGQVVQGLQQQIESRGELDKVSFGMVGFRNNTDKTPGLQYVSKTLVPLKRDNDPQRFMQLASEVKATTVSSHSFNEDAFAGVMDAVDKMDWSPYAGRIILLVTDAGALRKNDPYSRTQMNEAQVREAALRKNIKIYALHLRTDAGKNNHAFAEQQYRSLTADANPKIGDLYVSVAGG